MLPAQLHEDVKMYMDQADVVNALTAATECSRVTAAHLGKDHVAFASSLNNIALVHKESGNTTQALNYYEEALRVYRATAGDEHPSTVSVIANLGLLYTRMAEGTRGLERQAILDTAQEYMEQALESRKEILFPGAPIVSVTKSHLANIRRLQKRLPAALELHEEALRGLADKPGKEHRAYGDALNGYAVALKDAGRFDEAEAAYREALALRLAATHETHPDVLVTEFNLAECLLAKGDTQACVEPRHALPSAATAATRTLPAFTTTAPWTFKRPCWSEWAWRRMSCRLERTKAPSCRAVWSSRGVP